jgi:prophage tail gpP-like protein
MPVPRPEEVAVITVSDGGFLDHWESVMVQLRWAESHDLFNFTMAEPVPSPKSFAALRFAPGAIVNITLAGRQALYGPITLRQSAMTEEGHMVQLMGKSFTWQLAKSSVVLKWANNGNFDGQNLFQIASTIAAQTGVTVRMIGDVDLTPFRICEAPPGVPAWDFIEQLARSRQTVLGVNESGELLLIGPHGDDFGDDFVEGGNIRKINVVIMNETIYKGYFAIGQDGGSDGAWGDSTAQIEVGPIDGSDPLRSWLETPEEHPDARYGVGERAKFEQRIHEGTFIEATITVQGWLQRDGSLWAKGKTYSVNAPSHLLNHTSLAAKTVTFTQDNEGGSLTTLELVVPSLLNGPLLRTDLPIAPPPADNAPLPIVPPVTPGAPGSPPGPGAIGSSPPPAGTVEIGPPVVTGGE